MHFSHRGLKQLNKGPPQLTEVMVRTEDILAVLSDNSGEDQQRYQDHFDHRSSKLAQSKGKEEERA